MEFWIRGFEPKERIFEKISFFNRTKKNCFLCYKKPTIPNCENGVGFEQDKAATVAIAETILESLDCVVDNDWFPCVFICDCKFESWVNDLSQEPTSHLYGLSPVWRLRCCQRCESWVKRFSQ